MRVQTCLLVASVAMTAAACGQPTAVGPSPVSAALSGAQAAARPSGRGPGYELIDCDAPPPFFGSEPWAWLPLFLPGEEPAFLSLAPATVTHGGQTWGAMQVTRDKNFGATPVPANTWLAGIIGDEWPPDTVKVRTEMTAFRVVAIEVDGTRHDINPSCFQDFSSKDGQFGVYNAWVRFSEPGTHTLKIVARQVRDFYFVYPFEFLGIADPLGLDGRRVFVAGEPVASQFDGVIVHEYALEVGDE